MGFVLLTLLVYCVVFNWFVRLRSVSCAQCCQCLWIVHSWLHVRFSLAFNIVLLIWHKNDNDGVQIEKQYDK